MHTLSMDRRHRRELPPMAAFGVTDPTASAIADIRTWDEAFRSTCLGGAMTCPAAQLVDPAAAAWVRRRGMCVDVKSIDEVDAATGAGITPARMVVCGSDASAAPLRRGCQVGAGRFVLGSAGQVAVLAAAARRRTPVVIDVTDGDEALDHALRTISRLEVFGVRMRLAPNDVQAALGRMTLASMAVMADVRRRYGALLTRIDVADVDLRGAPAREARCSTAMIEDALDEGCARHRLPRPAVIITPLARQRVQASTSAA